MKVVHGRNLYIGTTAERTSTSFGDDQYGVKWWDTDESALYYWDGSSWVEFGGGALNFTELNDAPGSYVGEGGKKVNVNSAEDALEFVEDPKNNLSAGAAPTVNDDSDDGYSVGSRWADTTNDKEYVCLDASVGAAVWVETTVGAGSDDDAIHDNVAGEINAIADKPAPVNADLVVIEDSENSYNKKKAELGNLPGGGGGSEGDLGQSDAEVAYPPTQGDLDDAFGDPTALGDGYAGILDHGGSGERVYLVGVQNGEWWYNRLDVSPEAEFDYYKTLTIQNGKVDGVLEDFPIAVVIDSDNDLRTTANGGYIENTDATGGISGALTVPADLIFSLDQWGWFPLDFEITDYDATTGKLTAFVKVPTVNDSEDTTIFICYGNSAVTDSQENISGTWSNSFEMVYHMEEESGDILDSSGNGRDMTQKNSPTLGQTGIIGKAVEFNGVNEWLQYDDQPVTAYPFTVEAWGKPEDHTASGCMIGWFSGNDYNYKALYINTEIHVYDRAGGGTIDAESTADAASDAWNYGVGVCYASDDRAAFLDGGNKGTDSVNAGYGTYNHTDIGRNGRPSDGAYFDGPIDEVRVSSVDREDAWFSTTFNNIDDPGTFYSIGSHTAVATIDAASEDITQVKKMLFMYESSGGADIPNSWSDISMDTVEYVDEDYYSVGASNIEITFQAYGVYMVEYSGSADVDDTSRSHVDWKLQIDRGLGYVDVPGSNRYSYHRTSSDGKDSASAKVLIEAELGDKIKLVARSDRVDHIDTLADGISIIIEKKL